jgi:hypothetical protein
MSSAESGISVVAPVPRSLVAVAFTRHLQILTLAPIDNPQRHYGMSDISRLAAQLQ